MSLSALVFRWLTVLALTDKTLAGDEVQSSLLMPINEVEQSPRPVLAVFTDSAKASDADIDGNDLLGARTAVTLALEIACMQKAPTKKPDEVVIEIPETDEGMETTIDIIARQALAELQAGTSVWATHWRNFRWRTVGMRAERGASVKGGVRFAARRIEIDCEILSDPIPGQQLEPCWAAALDAMDADDRTAKLSELVRALAVGTAVADWRQWQAELGLTDAGIRSLGIAPFEDAEADDGSARPAAELAGEDVDLDVVIRVDGDGATTQSGAGAPTPLIEASDG